MAVTASNQFQMIIYDKKPEILVINHFNKDECTETIETALNSGLLVKFNHDLQRNIKQHFMIIQSISFGLIINNIIEGYFPLSLCDIMNTPYCFKSVFIQNINVCFRMIWQNQLNMKSWMSDKQKYKLLFMFLLKLLKQHPKNMMKEFIDLILTIMNTNIYWTEKHFIWLIHHEFSGKFVVFLKYIYITRNMRITRNNMELLSALCTAFLNTTKIFYMYHYYNLQKNYTVYFDSWIKPITNNAALKSCKECKSKKQSRNNNCKNFHKNILHFHMRLAAFMMNFDGTNSINGSITISQKCKIISKKYKIFSRIKLCANINCKQKDDDCKFKICKQCKLVYYCSKHCQKIHWKNTHKKNCKKLHDKMNHFKWYSKHECSSS